MAVVQAFSETTRVRAALNLFGVLALGGLLAGYLDQPTPALQSYLYAWILFLVLTLGLLGLTLLAHVLKAQWTRPLLRIFEAGGGAPSLALMLVLFVPILLQLPRLYIWADPEVVKQDHILHLKQLYLNVPFFLGRLTFFFAVWMLLAALLRRSSLRQDRTGDPAERDYRTNLASGGLAAFCVLVTFAVTDWVMSLEPHWFSSVYGIWFLTQMAVTGLAFATAVLLLQANKRPYAEEVTPKLLKDLGTLMFAFSMFWAYITLSQYLIIYSANLPEFVPYYLHRSQHGWQALMWVVAALQFLLPFFVLLSPAAKRNARIVLGMVLVILAARVVDTFWIVMPALRHEGFELRWTDPVAVAAVAALWFSVFLGQLRKGALVPSYLPSKGADSHASH
ncbi:MAG: hypothetical protein N2109_02095 [Fimbriimonadales bacterium]|nr:hypothetical protein [Fimbriimonadales bacterium]